MKATKKCSTSAHEENTDQNDNEIDACYTGEDGDDKKRQPVASVGKVVEKSNPELIHGSKKWPSCCGRQASVCGWVRP